MKKYLSETHPYLIKDWNQTLNGNITFDSLTYGSGYKAWWYCNKCDENYQREVFRKVLNNKCPYCSGRKVCIKNCLATKFPEICKMWNFSKNENITPYNVTQGSDRKVWWNCTECNQDYLMSPKSKIHGHGCPFCAGKIVCCSNSFAAIRPDLIKFWHPTKNIDKKPEHFTVNSHEKIWWYCDTCFQSYETDIHNRLVSGCPYCSNKKAYIGNCLLTKCPEISKFWHPYKNYDLTPKDILPFSRKNAWWVCSSCNADFISEVRKITAKDKKLTLCKNCNFYYYEELCKHIMLEIFEKKFIKTRISGLVNIRNRKLELDCFNEKLKINIEYDGIQHFEYPNPFHKNKKQFENQQQNDLCKDKWCLNNEILNIRVPYTISSKNNIKDFIIGKLKEFGKI